jgi:hypothetical protein
VIVTDRNKAQQNSKAGMIGGGNLKQSNSINIKAKDQALN